MHEIMSDRVHGVILSTTLLRRPKGKVYLPWHYRRQVVLPLDPSGLPENGAMLRHAYLFESQVSDLVAGKSKDRRHPSRKRIRDSGLNAQNCLHPRRSVEVIRPEKGL